MAAPILLGPFLSFPRRLRALNESTRVALSVLIVVLDSDLLFKPPCSSSGTYLEFDSLALPGTPDLRSTGIYSLLDILETLPGVTECVEVHTFSSSP